MKKHRNSSLIRRAILCCCCVVACGSFLYAQNIHSDATESSCRQFVQQFYDWYLPNTHVKAEKTNGPALDFALKSKRSLFDPELVRAVEQGKEQARRDEEPFLDFDPVLNTQDPADKYIAEQTTVHGSHCSASVYGVWSQKKTDEPEVVAELFHTDQGWQFADFIYTNADHPDNKSLRRMLRFLLKGEQKSSD